jgi:hypothetical protein
MAIVTNLIRKTTSPVRALSVSLLFLVLATVACNDDSTCPGGDNWAPAAPRGLYSVTGDDQVRLFWYANTEPDLDGYDVWVSDDDEQFDRIGTVEARSGDYELEYIDHGARNGSTYFYAVTAFDDANNESDLSRETVFDTPRPEGYSWVASEQYDESIAGFNISGARRVSNTNPSADFIFYLGASEDEYLLAAGTGVWIQDMGYTTDFDDIGWGPYWEMAYGWSPTGIVEAIPGHTYVLLTQSDHYAKIRILAPQEGKDLDGEGMDFQWAYQQAILNQELVAP